MSGGGYKVNYLNAGQVDCYGTGDIINYRANYLHTTGAQVRPFNGPSQLLGMRTTVLGRIGETVAPLVNARVFAYPLHLPGIQVQALTNGTGYFSIYYKNGNSNFLPVWSGYNPPAEYYQFIIVGSRNGCNFQTILNNELWYPFNTVNPNSPSYYVADAGYDLGYLTNNQIILNPVSCE